MSPKTSKPLPTKKAMQKLKEKLKAKANSKLGREVPSPSLPLPLPSFLSTHANYLSPFAPVISLQDRDDSDSEFPTTPMIIEPEERPKFGVWHQAVVSFSFLDQ